ncbi:unnamed protein product [Paramecium primaurelia]|uniref:Uncharacterized protein n=1 Tax=Paramecium primaurelia TaxID=5886 RepID=A0A8S1PCD0_PARPR|nr:unnamed protein product [Paramecium primaurelia]CAD8100942.1 unnamed protein product [Paramecium primaurelia]
MKLYILFTILYCINASINYPTACDCNEHDNQESCEAHKCFWNQNECRISECNERTLENCIKASQFLSSNPKYCYIKNDNCVELNSCEQLQIVENPKIAREKCQLFQCAYDLVSGYCFKAEKCDQIYDKDTCNSYLIAQSHPLSLESFCYWDGTCKERKNWIQNCELINEQDVCEQAGCRYNNKVCQEIECENLSNKECNGEYVNNLGNTFLCQLIDQKCQKVEISNLNKIICNKLIGHTFGNNKCRKCISYAQHSKQ